LEKDPTLGNSDREFALRVAQTRREDPWFWRELPGTPWVLVQAQGGDKKSYATALQQARAAAKGNPPHPFILRTLGVAHYRLGDWKQAIANLEKAEELAPDRYLAWNDLFLCMAHWQSGDKEQARELYERAIQWMEKNQSNNEELRGFRVEAEELLGIKDEQSHSKDRKE
jgi:tetratricopeptide (TPR) repeat protein